MAALPSLRFKVVYKNWYLGSDGSIMIVYSDTEGMKEGSVYRYIERLLPLMP